ncbi:hypothetical protein CCZ01_09940, partial [Helicobacter monodelphidis]
DSTPNHLKKPLDFESFHDEEKSLRTRFKDNIEAMSLLKELMQNNTQATQEQQAILAKYSGFGGLNSVITDKDLELLKSVLMGDFAEVQSQLRKLLQRTDDAYYTPISVVQPIYESLLKAGFSKGRVLEPSLGKGIFFEAMPQSLKNNTQRIGVELDSLTAHFAKQLQPSTEIF